MAAKKKTTAPKKPAAAKTAPAPAGGGAAPQPAWDAKAELAAAKKAAADKARKPGADYEFKGPSVTPAPKKLKATERKKPAEGKVVDVPALADSMGKVDRTKELPGDPVRRSGTMKESHPDISAARQVLKTREAFADKITSDDILEQLDEQDRPDFDAMDVLVQEWSDAQRSQKSLDPDMAKVYAEHSFKLLFSPKAPPSVFHENRKLQAEFLYVFQKIGFVQTSCDLCGISGQAVRAARVRDPIFAALYEEAFQRYNDNIVREVYRRAVEGVERYVYSDGLVVRDTDGNPVVERHYSDQLLLKLWSYRDPQAMDKTVMVTDTGNNRAIIAEGGELDLSKLNRKQRDAIRQVAQAFQPGPDPDNAEDIEVDITDG